VDKAILGKYPTPLSDLLAGKKGILIPDWNRIPGAERASISINLEKEMIDKV